MTGTTSSPQTVHELPESPEARSLRASRDLLLSRACELGDKRSCDRSRRNLFGARCSGGDAYACTELAELISAAEGTNSTVRDLWDKACNLGNPVACKRLGR
jgi:hypothetical protein